MRTNFTQLPTVAETNEILKKEAKRPVPKIKQNAHFADFSTIIRWLRAINLSPSIFSEPMPWEQVMAEGARIQNTLVKRTVAAGTSNEWIKLMTDISNYLAEKDPLEKADLILVFGSKDLRRAHLAVNYFDRGLAPRIVMSGGRAHYQEKDISEAATFQSEAIRLGVPKDKILTEPNSLTIPDNIRSTLNLLDEKQLEVKSVICIVSWFALRRAWVHLKKYAPQDLRIIRTAPEPISPSLSPKAWFRYEEGIRVVFNEFVKMRVAELMNTA